MSEHKKIIRGVVLKVGPDEYLRHTDADWGPKYTTCGLDEAAVFDAADNYGIDQVCRSWGDYATRVPVRITVTRKLEVE